MAKARLPLPTDYIDEYLELLPGGVLAWKKSPHPRIAVGEKAGRKPKGNHLQVTLNRRAYGYHRIVYYLAYSIDSIGYEIDHINRNPEDNRPENLRLASEAENKWNKTCQSNSQSGYRGIRKRFWGKSYRWEVTFQCRYIGSYQTLDEAIQAWEREVKTITGEFFCPQQK